MKPRSSVAMYSFACALIVLSACTRSLTIDEGQGQAGAAGESAGQGGAAASGQAGEAGNAGAAGEAGAVGQAGTAGEAGTGEAGAGQAGSAEAGTGEAGTGQAGDAGEGGDGFGGSGDDGPLVTTQWTGNDPSCPDAHPSNEQACDIEEGRTCAYYYEEAEIPSQTFYSECACRTFCGGEQKWDCYRQIASGYMDCPATQPEQDSACFGSKGLECWYPTNVTCTCPTIGDDPTWRCGLEAAPPAEHPTAVDETAIVGDLTAEQRAAWCAWYAPVEPGFPQPHVLPADADGFYPDTGCNTTGSLGCNIARPTDLPAAACEANLALSTCEATVFDLNDCVLSMKTGSASPNGCARYIDAPGCSGTIVNALSGEPNASFGLPGDNSCLVLVE